MEEQITTGQVAKKWGLIYGLIGLIVNLTPIILEIQVSWIQVVNIALAFVMFIMANKEFKSLNGGYMAFGEGFKINMIMALIAGSVRSIISYVYVKFIDPTVSERIQEALTDAWREQGMGEEQIEQAQRFTGGLTNPEIGLVLGVIVVLVGALVWGSIVSAVIKNEVEDF